MPHSFLKCSNEESFDAYLREILLGDESCIIRHMPLQLQFDFRFSRALKEHLKQMCRTKFCYYTNATYQYPRVKSDLRYSELPKMSPPTSAQSTKSQVGQSVTQKTVRNMSTKDNPGPLPMNLFLRGS